MAVVIGLARLAVVVILALGATKAIGHKTDMPRSIQEVKAKYEPELMNRAGVVSVGIGRDDDGKTVIVIGLDGKHPETQDALPKELEGYAVRVEVIGPIRAK